jgi:hypothetical protein
MKYTQLYVKKLISYLTENKLRLHSEDVSVVFV